MGADEGTNHDAKQLWRPSSRPTEGATLPRSRDRKRDVVELLVRDLRALIATVDQAGDAPHPGNDAEVEAFDRFVVGLAVHLVVEDLVVRPIITRVLQRQGLIEERKEDIDLIVSRLARARTLASRRFKERIRDVRTDLAEHAQRTEIGLLVHAYRVYDEEAREALADKHPQATDRMLDAVRSRHGDHLPATELDRPFLAWLEAIACQSLDIERLACGSSVTAVPPGAFSDPRRALPPRGFYGTGEPEPGTAT